jgi:polysaccharide export outer membrane protein
LERLNGIVINPEVTISVSTPRPLSISVLGEVRQQGNYTIPFGEGVLGALARAGGLTEFAKADRVFVLREWPKRVRVRFNYEDLRTGEMKSVAFRLRDRDIVIVE